MKKGLIFWVWISAFLYHNAGAQNALVDGLICDFLFLEKIDYSEPQYSQLNIVIQGENTLGLHDVALFYNLYGCRTAWLKGNSLNVAAQNLISILKNADAEGLNSENYHFAKLSSAAQNIKNLPPQQLLEYELLFADAALAYAKHLRFGKVNPYSLNFMYEVTRDDFDIPAALNAVLSNQESLVVFFENLVPQYRQYQLLKQNLEHFRQNIAAAATPIPVTLSPNQKAIKPTEHSESVALLRRRLQQIYPDLPTNYSNSGVFDTTYLYTDTLTLLQIKAGKHINLAPDLSDAVLDSFYVTPQNSTTAAAGNFDEQLFDVQLLEYVKKFQYSCNLDADGVVGTKTLAFLNRSDADKIKEIQLAMEAWRWLPRNVEGTHILVNIAASLLTVYEGTESVIAKRVAVGKPSHKTPVFSDLMTYFEVNPYWSVPYSIATNEILPILRRNAGYLAANNMKLYNAAGKIVNPYAVNWGSVSAKNFPYAIKQMPGADNALGYIKYMFPNEYNIYIHDTPSRHLFKNSYRAVSHGCVRLENPLELAQYIMQQDQSWTPTELTKVIDEGKNKIINLPKPIPVDLVYITVWIDENDNAVFYEDIYERNSMVRQAFFINKR